MKNRFDFYEIVRILDNQFTRKNNLASKEGGIIGMFQGDDGKWYYSVSILGETEGWDLEESNLESTGKFGKREDFFTEEILKVRVDPDSGEGTPI